MLPAFSLEPAPPTRLVGKATAQLQPFARRRKDSGPLALLLVGLWLARSIPHNAWCPSGQKLHMLSSRGRNILGPYHHTRGINDKDAFSTNGATRTAGQGVGAAGRLPTCQGLGLGSFSMTQRISPSCASWSPGSGEGLAKSGWPLFKGGNPAFGEPALFSTFFPFPGALDMGPRPRSRTRGTGSSSCRPRWSCRCAWTPSSFGLGVDIAIIVPANISHPQAFLCGSFAGFQLWPGSSTAWGSPQETAPLSETPSPKDVPVDPRIQPLLCAPDLRPGQRRRRC